MSLASEQAFFAQNILRYSFKQIDNRLRMSIINAGGEELSSVDVTESIGAVISDKFMEAKGLIREAQDRLDAETARADDLEARLSIVMVKAPGRYKREVETAVAAAVEVERFALNERLQALRDHLAVAFHSKEKD